jgi:hypothetical protein
MEQLKRGLSEAIRRGVTLSLCAVAANCGGKSEAEDDAPFNQASVGGTAGGPGGQAASAGMSAGTTAEFAGASGGGGSSGMPAGGGSAGMLAAGGSLGLSGTGGVGGLEPYPTDSIGCYGQNYGGTFGGYDGQCCVSVECLPLEGGVCPPASSAAPPGSGTCSCSSPLEKSAMGPYAPTPADTANGKGACCYLVAAIGCEGRPLLIEGRALLAPVVTRADWSAQRA